MSDKRGGWGRTVKERLVSGVRPGPNGCLEWQGAIQNGGYGLITLKRPDGRWHSRTAHRVAWELANGPIPAGQCVLHACDNRRCANVVHLFLGTHKDNMADKVAKGRQSHALRGTAHPLAKLTEAKVREIRKLRVEGRRVCDIARAVGCPQGAVSSVLARRSWGWVE